jgi:hypothetical protein
MTAAAIDLCTVADVKQELEITSDTSRDVVIQSVITGVSRAITTMCEREFRCEVSLATAVTRTFEIRHAAYVLDLNPYDLHDTTSMVVKIHPNTPDEFTVAASDLVAEPVGSRWTYERIRFSSLVTQLHESEFTRNFGYTIASVASQHWGFDTVPEDVKRAAIVSTAANLDRRLDAYSFAAGNDLVDMDAGVQPARQMAFSIPMAAMILLNPYRRHVGAF